MYHITEAELRYEVAREALVHRLKTFTLFDSTPKRSTDARHLTKPSGEERKVCFRRMKEEKGQAQPQLYGT